jgi:2Fe-2S ferredoxin
MAGVNPYIAPVKAQAATKPFTVTFVEEETGRQTLFTVEPGKIPYGRTGVAGSLYDIAEGAGLEIDHACGGVCACATCHVYVSRGLKSCSAATDDEEDMLDTARGLTPESRLSCQCVPNGSEDLTVVIPKWNKNLAKEAHH